MERNTVRTTFLGEFPFNFTGKRNPIKSPPRFRFASRPNLFVHLLLKLINRGQSSNVDSKEKVSGPHSFRRGVPWIIRFIDPHQAATQRPTQHIHNNRECRTFRTRSGQDCCDLRRIISLLPILVQPPTQRDLLIIHPCGPNSASSRSATRHIQYNRWFFAGGNGKSKRVVTD